MLWFLGLQTKRIEQDIYLLNLKNFFSIKLLPNVKKNNICILFKTFLRNKIIFFDPESFTINNYLKRNFSDSKNGSFLERLIKKILFHLRPLSKFYLKSFENQ